ncbi:unnamed protein product [Schistosoma margrebowiei]|uniref:Uncharacterized protein n=1 Tax=Schistosoma margrebowiei TaxID=48269 RepID=A0A183MT96_9TREM|nr:unnamed protein product [Schistosoma margrebowiei]
MTEPLQLGPFVDVVTSYIKLTNPLDRAVGFKIKTTVPKCYCVKPSNGYIEPHQTVEVAVMLQPFSYNAAEKFNHKFMIQSIIAPDDPRPAMEQLVFVFHPDDFDFTAKNRERMLIQSAVSAEEADPKKDQTKPVHDTGATQTDIEKLMAEISALRQENAALKESDLHLRRTAAVSDTCRMPTESGARSMPINGSRHHNQARADTFSNIPPILYLITALIIGLFVGRFVL